MSERSSTSRWSAAILSLVWLISAVYMGASLDKGWMAYDDCTLGQSAERVLHGEMPHRDFHDVYTGGLAYGNAAVFRIFGVNLFALRVFVFVVFLAWVPAVYALAAEFTSPRMAGLVTLIAVVWSIPNYTTPMPSWYSLMLASCASLVL